MALDKEIRVKELNASGSSAVKSIDPYMVDTTFC